MSTWSPKANTLLLEAAELPPGKSREDLLAEACGNDAELRQQVDALLLAGDQAGSFLESPTSDESPTILQPPLIDLRGTVVGPYKLLQQIGEGGMGIVFMAEQTKPVQRFVALKIIKPGMDSRQVIARFEAERQALALMDHPNIAHVFDAGTTETGQPYFVMELVKGVPVTRYCDEHRLTVRERLELFIPVCHAIQHAHQKGIIHRDLKPSNVLVALYDGRPVPKVIDFGVAKATGPKLTERTLFTEFGAIIGTFEYMSPEQAVLNQLDVDTRTDVYTLGVLLYELLTGTTPFDHQRLKITALAETLQIIREEDPPRPSTRLSTTSDLPSIAANRGTEPTRLRGLVQVELDWIVMKCLEKDRDRRYETANGLVHDVERYLADEPVQAGPPSAAYRFRKFARRNKVALATSVIVAASLLLGTVVSVWQATLALRAERLAESRLEAEQEARQQATAETKKATAINDLLRQMLETANPDASRGSDYTVRQMLDDFSEKLEDQLKDQPESEAAIRATIGNAYRRLGLLDKAELHLNESLGLRRRIHGLDHPQIADSLVDSAWLEFEKGELTRAEDFARDALAIHRKLKSPDSSTIRARDILALILWQQGRFREMEEVGEEILAISRRQPDGLREAAEVLSRMADIATQRGDAVQGEQLAREAVELHSERHRGNHLGSAYGLEQLGGALLAQQKLDEAEQCYREALTIFRELYDDSHVAVVQAVSRLANVLRIKGDEAELEQLRNAATNLPDVGKPEWGYALYSGILHAELSQWDLAEASFAEAMEQAPIQRNHALYQIALVRLVRNDKAGYRRACALYLEQAEQTKDADFHYWAAWTSVLSSDSVADLDRVSKLAASALDANPHDPDLLTTYGAALYRAGRFEPARRRLVDAIDRDSAAEQHTGAATYARLFLAMTDWRLNRTDEARQRLSQATETIKSLKPARQPGATTQWNEGLARVARDRWGRGEFEWAVMPWNQYLTLQLLRQETEQVLAKRTAARHDRAFLLTAHARDG